MVKKTSSDFTPIQKDDRQHKKRAGAELKNKKGSFLGKNCEKKLSFKAKNWPILKKKEKRDISGQNEQAWAELKKKKKKDFLGQKLSKKLSLKAKNWPIIKIKRKKRTFPAKKTSCGWAWEQKKDFVEQKLWKKIEF